MDKIKPIDDSTTAILKNYTNIIIIEDNFNSGLYNTICQFVAEKRISEKFVYSISVDEDFGATTGSTTFLDERFGTSPKKIAEFITNLHK